MGWYDQPENSVGALLSRLSLTLELYRELLEPESEPSSTLSSHSSSQSSPPLFWSTDSAWLDVSLFPLSSSPPCSSTRSWWVTIILRSTRCSKHQNLLLKQSPTSEQWQA